METLFGRIEVIWKWCWYYEEILESFSEIISVKFEKNWEKMLQKICKNLEGDTELLSLHTV